MLTPDAKQLIEKLQKGLEGKKFDIPTIIADLQDLRPNFIETKDPLITKVIRLCYEHFEKNNGFKIGIPEEEVVDEEGNVIEKELPPPANLEEEVESFGYLLSLITKGKHKLNRADITQYRNLLMESLK